jgi:hypothetical protein
MYIFDFKKQFDIERLGTEQEGEAHFKILRTFILNTPETANIVFELSGMTVFSHSYAKQTIAMLCNKLYEGNFQKRHFFIKTKDRSKVEDLEKAMEKVAKPILSTTSSNINNFYENYFVIGPLALNLKYALEILIQKKKITTGELAKASSESSIQNASNKLRKLEALKLIERTTPSDRSGNVLSGRRIEVI